MGFALGKKFSEIPQALEHAQLEGELTDKAAAIAFVQHNWPAPQGK